MSREPTNFPIDGTLLSAPTVSTMPSEIPSDDEMLDDDLPIDWDPVLTLPPPTESGTFAARWNYLGDNPPLQIIFPGDIPEWWEEDE